MKVLFDARWLVDGPPSGARVVEGLIAGWRSAFPDDRLTLWAPAGSSTAGWPDHDAVILRGSRRLPHGAWVAAAGPGVTRGHDTVVTQNFAPLLRPRGAASAVFVHDALFEERPEWFTRAERAYLGGVRHAVRTATVVATSSRSEAARITRLLAPRSLAVPVGLAVPGRLTSAISRMPALPPGTSDFILCVGRLNVRKNLARLVEAFASSDSSRTHSLVIVGESNGRGSELPVGDASVIWLGGCTDDELRWLYEHASLLAFPALDEGFGMPLIEADRFGLPVASSDIPVFREIGVSAEYFDPHDTMSIAAALTRGVTGSVRSSSPRWQLAWTDVAARLRAAVEGRAAEAVAVSREA